MNAETELLFRYLDGEMSPEQAQQFRARLSDSPELTQKLHEMQRLGALVRLWASAVEPRADTLVEPTLSRVAQAQRKRARQNNFGYALAALLALALPWARQAPSLAAGGLPGASQRPAGAAIERIEAVDKQAQVFVVAGSSTPVVWLSDDVTADDDVADEQDPG